MWLSKSLHVQADKESKEHSRLKDNFQLVFSPLCLKLPTEASDLKCNEWILS